MLILMLLVLCCSSDALNEIGDQVRQLLLAARGQPMKDRRGNGGNTALLVGRLTLFAPHGFPPLPGPESLHQVC